MLGTSSSTTTSTGNGSNSTSGSRGNGNSTSGNSSSGTSGGDNAGSGSGNGRDRGNKAAQNKRRRERGNERKAAARAQEDSVRLQLQSLPARDRAFAERAIQLSVRIGEALRLAVSSSSGDALPMRGVSTAIKARVAQAKTLHHRN